MGDQNLENALTNGRQTMRKIKPKPSSKVSVTRPQTRLVYFSHRLSSIGEYIFQVLFLTCVPHQQLLAFSSWSSTMTVFYLSDMKKTRRVQYQRCHTYVGVCQEVCSGKLCQRQLKDPRVSEEKHCQSQVQEGCHLLF